MISDEDLPIYLILTSFPPLHIVLIEQRTHRTSPSGIEFSAPNLPLLRKGFFREFSSLTASLKHLNLVSAEHLLDILNIVFIDTADGSAKIQGIRYSVETTFAANYTKP
jgi:hypothetical protein